MNVDLYAPHIGQSPMELSDRNSRSHKIYWKLPADCHFFRSVCNSQSTYFRGWAIW